MEGQLARLIQLQEIDTKIRTQEEQRNRLPELLNSLDRRRAESREGLEKVKEALLAAQMNKRDRDQDLEVGAQKVERLKARSSEIKNNKEYQAQLKEIETAEQENKAIEDSILVLMEKIDAAAAQITVAEQRMREEGQAIAEEQKKYEDAFAKLWEEIKATEQARQEAMAQIDPSVLERYRKLMLSKGGIAMAEARGESCSGCYMSIPPQVFVNVKKNESIISCPQCGRLLYVKETIVQKNT